MSAATIMSTEKNKIHPYKFTLWVAMASMLMMFAGLTSALIVKSNLAGWRTIVIPKLFWASTILIVASSIIMHFAVQAFKSREMSRYRSLMVVVAIMGIVFVVCQYLGFKELWFEQNIRFRGSSGAGQFFYAIAGLHGIHVIGGIVALIWITVKTFVGKNKNYSIVPVEVMATYWHFVDILWLYLMVFFIIIG